MPKNNGSAQVPLLPGEQIEYQSPYGAIPKFLLFALIPFLLIMSAAVSVRAHWYNKGVEFQLIPLSPINTAYAFSAVGILICCIGVLLEIYHRMHPREVIVTNQRLILPRHRFTDQTISIAWGEFSAKMVMNRFVFFEFYDITLRDLQSKSKTIIRSAHFRNFDDFATFALLIGETLGMDWSIKGFLPGRTRGRKN
ncbi:MAG: hypothetical protein HKN47_20925 [Pirellulaceae bacterium]|nr:hypothetical protein [Pirellulaceae bacterium]